MIIVALRENPDSNSNIFIRLSKTKNSIRAKFLDNILSNSHISLNRALSSLKVNII